MLNAVVVGGDNIFGTEKGVAGAFKDVVSFNECQNRFGVNVTT